MSSALPLSAVDLATIQRSFELMHHELGRMGFTVTFSPLMAGWLELISRAPGRAVINPTFNPEVNELSPDDSFWIRLEETKTGRPVACIANRVFECEDFWDLIRGHSLWWPQRCPTAIDVVLPAAPPRIGGRIGHHGGLWIDPDWRKHGLSGYMTRLARCASLRRFLVDWHCGLVMSAIAEKGLPTDPVAGYGYPRMLVAIDGRQPFIDGPARLYVPWISRPEILEGLRAEADRLVGDRHQETVRETGLA